MSTQHERAVERAQDVIAAYNGGGDGRDYYELFGDLLADLMHYWHELKIDREVDSEDEFDTLISTAEMHFTEEIEDHQMEENL